MKIDAHSAVNTAFEIIEKAFDSIEWLLDDAGVPEELTDEFQNMLSEIQSEVRADARTKGK